MDLLLRGAGPPNNPESWMQRYIKPVVVGIALITALFLTFSRHGADGGLSLLAQRESRAEPSPAAVKDYDLTALRVFTVILGRVKDHYVDPGRIRPREMLVSALNAVERSVAEVLVEEHLEKKNVVVKVQDAQRTFDIAGVDSPWALSSAMKTILRFVRPHLNASTDVQDVEYAAINGMLATLDPHSVVLKPEAYNEMKLTTRGQFGGLGIVISMIQGELTVMNPMKGTPATEMGIKACDRILKIGEESTVNMTLTQAVSRLRGAPGSKVTLTLTRGASTQPMRKTLTRAVIKVDSVTSRMLEKKIGYVNLNSFQGNSVSDLREHVRKLERNGMKGLVLDLRNNPGGLLDQAVKISDLFIDSGTLVTTVSYGGKQREEKRAKAEGTEDRFPMAVLVNSGSASASEIVAGALRQLDRAVVIGARTFGKGTVQVLYDNDDGSALKLTIAEYLTPGDVSIQGVGIRPDIATRPVVVRKDLVRLRQGEERAPREEDLQEHLISKKVRRDIKPLHNMRYLAPNRKPEELADEKTENLCLYPDRKCAAENEDKFVEDFQIKLARDLLARARGWRRTQVLASATAQGFFDKVDRDEERRVSDELRRLGVDWSPLPANAAAGPAVRSGQPKLAVTVANVRAKACEELKLRVTVRNVGDAPTTRLRGVTKSDYRILSGHELVFGRIEPGASRSWTVPVPIRDAPTRTDAVSLEFHDAQDTKYPPHKFQFWTRGVERPTFAYSYQLIDDEQGSNQDGRAQRGEKLRLLVKVRNTGKGRALRAMTSLKNLSGRGIFLHKGRFVFGTLAPGAMQTASFTFTLRPSFDKPSFKLQLRVQDDGLGDTVADKLTFPVADSGTAPEPASGTVRVADQQATVRAWPAADAPVVGEAPRGTAFPVLGRLGGWYRVLVEKERPAFVASSEVAPGNGSGSKRFASLWQVTPPKLELDVPALATDKKSITISGRATDETRVSDLFIFVRNPAAKIDDRKVYYLSQRHAKEAKVLTFSADVPLWPGANYVTVFARENEDVQATEMVVIFRGKPAAVAVHDEQR